MRICFAILAALLASLVVNLKAGNPLINGITIGMAVYVVTFYLLRWLFMSKVEKPTKILTMGVGAYALTFIFFWVIFVTPFLAPPNATFNIDPKTPEVGETITFTSTSEDPDGVIIKWIWDFGDETSSKEGVTITHSYAVAGDYTIELKVVDEHGISSSNTANITVSLPT